MRKLLIQCSSTVVSRLAFVLLISITSVLVPSIAGKTLNGSVALSQSISTHWLYVLDTKRRAYGDEILLVDADTGQVAKTIPAGFSPNFVVSPKASRAYVVSKPKTTIDYVLQVLTLPEGNVLNTQTVVDRRDYTSFVPPHTIVISPNGLLLYVMTGVPQRDEYSVVVYEASQGGFLGRVSLPKGCGGNYLLPSENALYVLCSRGNNLSIFSASLSGLSSESRTVQLPAVPSYVVTSVVPTSDTATSVHPALVGAILSSDGRTLTVVTSYMRLL